MNTNRIRLQIGAEELLFVLSDETEAFNMTNRHKFVARVIVDYGNNRSYYSITNPRNNHSIGDDYFVDVNEAETELSAHGFYRI